MAVRDGITPRIGFLMIVGFVITLLAIAGANGFWQGRNYQLATLFISSAALLAFIFFRRRWVALLVIALSFLLVNVGLTAVFHPSVAGILITLGSAAGLLLLVRWHASKYPHLKRKDWKKIFDNNPEQTT